MRRAIFSVFAKEFLENLRDRRTLFSALLFGPLFGPLLFGTMVSRLVEQSVMSAKQPLVLTIAGGGRAPGLMEYLRSQNVQIMPAPLTEDEARKAVQRGDLAVVLLVPPDYPRLFTAGQPAPLLLIADSSDSQTRKIAARARAILAGFSATMGQLRLQVRGVDPLLAAPLAVNDVDVATPAGRAVVVLGLMTYFVLFAVLMGGLYLAIDATAGERERGSLEALLALPVPRAALVGGKVLATCAFMCLSLAITLAAFLGVFKFLPLERLGMSPNLGVRTSLEFFAICLPFVPLGATLMTFVASFTKSYREAQTYLAAVLLVPTLPIAFAAIYSLKTKSSLMLIPSLSQHLLMTSVLQDRPIAAGDVLVSAAASLALAAALFVLTARHWRRETMLG
ncbi:MAG TPA: ABC transporter permease subunit [Steroidobacteraceae bacterium]|nr:ABC transporter permease subunit [Steroidobacteraceae bacterium]